MTDYLGAPVPVNLSDNAAADRIRGPVAFTRYGRGRGRSLASASEPIPERNAELPMDRIDRQVGERIRDRRITLGLSQHQLGMLVGVTTQQEHKYEHGVNRITGGRLYLFAQALGVSPSWFFEDSDATVTPTNHRSRLCLEMSRVYAAIENGEHQEALLQMARALLGPATPAD